jgi:glucose/arabinose dehydrogenase/PKD repeat protein
MTPSRRSAYALVVVALLSAATASLSPSYATRGPDATASSRTATNEPPATSRRVDFSDTLVASVPSPTAFTWTPDGRMLIASKPGRLMVVDDGQRSVAVDISARICDQSERGLLGVAVDPAFERNRFVYLYYTHEVGGACADRPGRFPQSRVGRFILGNDNVLARRSERVIVDHLVSPAPYHLAGDLEFGEDALLYISVGDGVCSLRQPSRCGPVNDNAPNRSVPLGKILRVDRHGVPPDDNPYASANGARRCARPSGVQGGTGPCSEIFARGFRNPFRFARKPGTNTFYVNDVGLHTWEEVDRLRKGGNYGWNSREGHCRRDSKTRCGTVRGLINPIHDYLHGKCRSITGGAFVPKGLWPGHDGAYLYADFGCDRVFRLSPEPGGGLKRTRFAEGLDGPTHLRFGPHEGSSALYYASFFGGEVRRIASTSTGTPPVAAFDYRPDGRTLAFDGSASSDPDGQTITAWHWSFGDGTTRTTSRPRVTHTYATTGPFGVTLSVTDGAGQDSLPVTRTVFSGEHPPSVTITSPPTDARFAVGQEVDLSASATDPEDGALPGSSLTWTVRLRHANHFHPIAGPSTGSSTGVTYPAPEELAATENSWLVATVEATDSRGLSTTVNRRLLPHQVELTFDADPRGADVVVQGTRRATRFTVVSWAGHVLPVRAPDQRIDGREYAFRRWSDGGARSHDIETPARPTTYAARFVRR